MPTIGETSSGANTQLNATLAAGLNTLDLNQTVTFTKYIRVMLPLDGFVFWVNASIVGSAALASATRFNQLSSDYASALTGGSVVQVQGSIHYSTQKHQEDEETYSTNDVVFTATSEVQDFNQTGPATMFVGEFEGVRFAFGQRGSFYVQASLYHYTGTAIYSVMAGQLIDSIDQLNLLEPVVSNSLPIWLSLANQPGLPAEQQIQIPIFPAMAVPNNFPPPFVTVHVYPDSTQSLAASPVVGRNSSRWQLVKERVVVTLYGVRSDDALDFLQRVFDFTLNTELLGIMNMPTVRDERQNQAELGIMAVKKSIEFEVNYLQGRVLNVARQLISSSIPTYSTP